MQRGSRGASARSHCGDTVFNSSQALGGHRGNSLEHKERVEELKAQGSVTLLEQGADILPPNVTL